MQFRGFRPVDFSHHRPREPLLPTMPSCPCRRVFRAQGCQWSQPHTSGVACRACRVRSLPALPPTVEQHPSATRPPLSSRLDPRPHRPTRARWHGPHLQHPASVLPVQFRQVRRQSSQGPHRLTTRSSEQPPAFRSFPWSSLASPASVAELESVRRSEAFLPAERLVSRVAASFSPLACARRHLCVRPLLVPLTRVRRGERLFVHARPSLAAFASRPASTPRFFVFPFVRLVRYRRFALCRRAPNHALQRTAGWRRALMVAFLPAVAELRGVRCKLTHLICHPTMCSSRARRRHRITRRGRRLASGCSCFPLLC